MKPTNEDDEYESILPPNWQKDDNTNIFFNDLTNKRLNKNPFSLYLEIRENYLNNDDSNTIWEEFQVGNDYSGLSSSENKPDFEPSNEVLDKTQNSNKELTKMKKNIFFEFYTKWNERDLFGKIIIYGLSIRFDDENQTSMVKFDGANNEWIPTVLDGPYGPIELYDLYVGSTIKIFGRHLTISGANSKVIQWIEKEHKKLLKQQVFYQKKIESIGETPIIKRQGYKDTILHITRPMNVPGHYNLRKLTIDNNKLGEQLAHLGLANQLL
jgi:hypothetical protein